jgi:hypothetical protein
MLETGMHNTAGECEVTNHARAITSLSGLVSPAPLCFQLPTFITTTYNIQIALFSVSIFPTQASGRWRKLEHEAKSVPGSQVPYTPHRLSINTLVREAPQELPNSRTHGAKGICSFVTLAWPAMEILSRQQHVHPVTA